MDVKIMKFKKMMLVALVLLAILTIGAVSASDDNQTSMELTVSEDLDVESSVNGDVIAEDSDVGNFSELKNKIDNALSPGINELGTDYDDYIRKYIKL